MQKRQKKINQYSYYLIIVILALLIETAISYILPMMVTISVHGWLQGEMNEMFEYFLITTILKIAYLGLPVYLFGVMFMNLRSNMKNPLRKMNIVLLYNLASLFTFLLFVWLVPDFKDFLGFSKYAPYLGYFYYSLVNGFIASSIAGRVVNIWYDNPLKEG